MATTTIDCSFCYNKTDIEYEIDDDGEWETPSFCPFCGIKEDVLDVYDEHYADHIEEFDEE